MWQPCTGSESIPPSRSRWTIATSTCTRHPYKLAQDKAECSFGGSHWRAGSRKGKGNRLLALPSRHTRSRKHRRWFRPPPCMPPTFQGTRSRTLSARERPCCILPCQRDCLSFAPTETTPSHSKNESIYIGITEKTLFIDIQNITMGSGETRTAPSPSAFGSTFPGEPQSSSRKGERVPPGPGGRTTHGSRYKSSTRGNNNKSHALRDMKLTFLNECYACKIDAIRLHTDKWTKKMARLE